MVSPAYLAIHVPQLGLVTPTGTRLSWQGIELTSIFSFDAELIPSQVPMVYWDRLGLHGFSWRWRGGHQPCDLSR